jgi:molybdenum cofactor cytidylyltransferase
MSIDTAMNMSGPAAAILLASGFSKRFGGRNKLSVPFRGKPLARYTLELAIELGFPGGIYFVTASDDVAALTADLPGVKTIKNFAPEKGLRESVRLGVEAACAKPAPDAEYYLFFHCDQPLLDAATVKLILEERCHGCIVEPRYHGRPGNPCLFSALFREELLSLGEGKTPRFIKERHPEKVRGVEVSNPLILEDVDNEEALERLLGQRL